MLPLAASCLLLAAQCISGGLALPPPSIPIAGTSVLRRYKRPRSSHDQWAQNHRNYLEAKYRTTSAQKSKRANSGASQLVNYGQDNAYFTTVSIGTPPVQYRIVLDTGSSDFWLVTSACLPGCASASLVYYSPTGSSTLVTTAAQPFGITYSGGSVNGTTATETVALAGITVKNQAFGIITVFDGNSAVLPPSVSGLMGLAWPALATIGTPWWQNSAQALPAWPMPLFTFAISREAGNPTATVEEPGGLFTVGTIDASLYTGTIDYVSIPANEESWWLLPVTEITIDGSTMQLGTNQLGAIDTGTTLIGGPSQIVAALYANVPGAKEGTGSNAGFFFLPCSTSVSISFSFGSRLWTMDPQDFVTPTGTNGLCMGALFGGTFGQPGTASPTWIIGDAFLKNVYSVFRYDPPAVGFATLANPSALLVNFTGVLTATGAASTAVPITHGPAGTPISVYPTATAGSGLTASAESWRKAKGRLCFVVASIGVGLSVIL